MISIKNVEILDDERGEAFFTLTDVTYELNVFQGYKFNGKFDGQIGFLFMNCLLQNPTDYGTTEIFHSKSDQQILMGQLTEKGLEIGEFIFAADGLYLPGDIKIGDFIEGTISRADGV